MKETAQLFDRQRVVPINESECYHGKQYHTQSPSKLQITSDHLYPGLWTDAPDVTIEEAR
jgi:hypothetical protein